MKLYDLVELEENNSECVVLKVKEGSEDDLVKLGCFDGNEKMFRMTKGACNLCTVFSPAGARSWEWEPIESPHSRSNLALQGKAIAECIIDWFDIYIGDCEKLVDKSLEVQSKSDARSIAHSLLFIWAGSNPDKVIVKKDGVFYGSLEGGLDRAISRFENLGFAVRKGDPYFSTTDCHVLRCRAEPKEKGLSEPYSEREVAEASRILAERRKRAGSQYATGLLAAGAASYALETLNAEMDCWEDKWHRTDGLPSWDGLDRKGRLAAVLRDSLDHFEADMDAASERFRERMLDGWEEYAESPEKLVEPIA